jgi:hypothetical protein
MKWRVGRLSASAILKSGSHLKRFLPWFVGITLHLTLHEGAFAASSLFFTKPIQVWEKKDPDELGRAQMISTPKSTDLAWAPSWSQPPAT